jgi:ATP-dependent DNA helicase RecG
MGEQQDTEYKTSWHDEYLKWICGFANANGGTLYIGRDDDGNVVGVSDSKKLMEDLPNKIRDGLGVMGEINLLQENGQEYIEIIVPPYSVPISFRGRYYYRSGSTKQELIGNALNAFLLKKAGRTWDDSPEPRATVVDIDEGSVASFLKASEKAGRLPEDELVPLPELLEKLRLFENGQLKRAAVVLFGKDPGKFYANMTVKIGRFGKTDDDLKFEESEEGNIITCLQKVSDQLNRKFFTKPIDFEGLQRIEKGEYPVAALREMLLNALVHRDYMGSNIQIRVYDDRFCIWNEGFLPEGLSLDALKRQHPSRPRNPIIADVCFKGGYIDAWGRGTLKIINACKQAGLPEPEIKEQDGGLLVTLFKDRYTLEQLSRIGLNDRQIKVVLHVKEKGRVTNSEYQKISGVSKATATRDIKELEEKKILFNKGTMGSSAVYELQ